MLSVYLDFLELSKSDQRKLQTNKTRRKSKY